MDEALWVQRGFCVDRSSLPGCWQDSFSAGKWQIYRGPNAGMVKVNCPVVAGGWVPLSEENQGEPCLGNSIRNSC